MSGLLQLDNGRIRATIAPGLGGAILDVVHVPSGLSALGRVPWDADLTPPADAPMTEVRWLPHYTGGWPVLFPNGGEACVIDGVAHGFHGEGSVTPWQAEPIPDGVILTRRFTTLPAVMRRRVWVEGETLVVAAEATATALCTAIWGEHVTFGSDLLDGPFRIVSGAAQVRADAGYDPPGNPLRPGAEGAWPHVAGRDGGTADLSRPAEGWAAMAYLTELARPEITVARDDGRLAATLSWEGEAFSCLWLWIELAATAEAPWNGQARLVGLEPCSTPAGHGLAAARAQGDRLVALAPGRTVRGTVRLRLAG